MSKAINDLYSEYWQYKNALYECKSKEEIDEIKWELEIPQQMLDMVNARFVKTR